MKNHSRFFVAAGVIMLVVISLICSARHGPNIRIAASPCWSDLFPAAAWI